MTDNILKKKTHMTKQIVYSSKLHCKEYKAVDLDHGTDIEPEVDCELKEGGKGWVFVLARAGCCWRS